MSPAQVQIVDLAAQLPWPLPAAVLTAIALAIRAWRRRDRQQAGRGLTWKEFLLKVSTERRLHRYSRLVDSADQALEALRIELEHDPPSSTPDDNSDP